MKTSTSKVEAIPNGLAQLIDGSKVTWGKSVGESSSRPSFLILNPKFGLIAVEIGALSDTAEQTRIRLNLKVDALKKQLRDVSAVPLIRISVIQNPKNSFEKISDLAFVIEQTQLKKIAWKDELPKTSLDEALLKKTKAILWPELSFVKQAYTGTIDKNRPPDSWLQIELDREQSRIATSEIKDVLIVSGPPGAGKTLVLCARARWFAREFPEKKCLFVVYNSMLEKLIRAQQPDWPSNVELVTLRALLKKNGHEPLIKLLNNFDIEPDDHDRRASKLLNEILGDGHEASFDALLVDEWQDFRAPYIKYLLACLRDKTHGAMFAGDSAQAIYTAGAAEDSLKGRKSEHVALGFSYRCTRQILDCAVSLDGDYAIDGHKDARDGEPVSLVRADYWATQAEGIAWEVSKLLSEDNRHPAEIAVLCTTKAGANHVAQAFESEGIEFELLTKFWDDVAPSAEKVNIMTIHGAKGYGFNVVFLMGFETLKDRDGGPERDMWGRVGFVGVTRAQDLLFIFYGKETRFTDNLAKCKKTTLTSRIFPSDYAI